MGLVFLTPGLVNLGNLESAAQCQLLQGFISTDISFSCSANQIIAYGSPCAGTLAMLAGKRARDLALVVFPAVFPRFINTKDHDAMTALAETAECEVKKLVTQQGHSLLARVLYTGKHVQSSCQVSSLNSLRPISWHAAMHST